MAHAAGVSVEGELGVVGYAGGKPSGGTDPGEVGRFVRETGVDALAVSVGTVHLMQATGAEVDFARLDAVQAAAPGVPLVLHGGSGLDGPTRTRLVRETAVCKVNIGTELRMAFGAALRGVLAEDQAVFDRIAILRATMGAVEAAARGAIRSLA